MQPAKESNEPEVILVSACLLGLPTRWDGDDRQREEAVRLAAHCHLVPVCPEQAGGLPTPRDPAEITEGDGPAVLDGAARVLNTAGVDVTDNYRRGAQTAARLAELTGARRALLKEGSPSCGVSRIRRNDNDVRGCGVTTALLRRKGIAVEGVE
ncbi:MAG: DUF523 domain-containing protein [Candidatus Brocadiia bacterium]